MKNLELYRQFFEEASDALLAIRLKDNRVVAANHALSLLTGFNHEEIEGEALSVLSPSLDEDNARDRRLDREIVHQPGFYNDIALATREGHIRYVTVKVRHTSLDENEVALCVLSDDTERQLLIRDLATKHQSLELAYMDLEKVHTELKVSQEKMAQASKLVALGELSAGLSHELNQPLTGIRGFAQEMGDVLKEGNPNQALIHKLCEEIILNSDKMALLLRHFRDFARRERDNFKNGEEIKPEPTSVKKVLDSSTTLLKKQLEKHAIEFEVRGIDETLWVQAQALPLEQVFVNLLTNSRDGILEKARDTSGHKGKILVTAENSGAFLLLRVRDNGAGISEGIRTKIFDPFFTTKDQGKGMGLGLSISFGIVHRFGGELILESSSASGTSFLLKLPLAAHHHLTGEAA